MVLEEYGQRVLGPDNFKSMLCKDHIKTEEKTGRRDLKGWRDVAANVRSLP